MLYIWPWQAPALPPERLISSMITEASARPRPEPPYSSRDQRGQPAGLRQRVDEGLGIAARLVDLAVVLVGELGAQRAHGVADVLVVVGFGSGSWRAGVGRRSRRIQASSAVACMASRPSWSARPQRDACRCRRRGRRRRTRARSNSGLTALNSKRRTRSAGRSRRSRSSSSVAISGPCTIRPGIVLDAGRRSCGRSGCGGR